MEESVVDRVMLSSVQLDGKKFLSFFPKVAYCIAYGSGVFSQTSVPSSSSPPMLDFIFAVDDPESWHTENLRLNPSHYNFLAAAGGGRWIAKLQDSSTLGARVWFNTLVPVPPCAILSSGSDASIVPQRLMKYGVVSNGALVEDLTHWSALYLAGRMHKPVRVLSDDSKEDDSPGSPLLATAIHQNLQAALSAALLTLPTSGTTTTPPTTTTTFSSLQLYAAVAGLSYAGDWRMRFGEDPNKVANIALGSLSAFHALYSPFFCKPPFSSILSVLGGPETPYPDFTMDSSRAARFQLGLGLPLTIQRDLSLLTAMSTAAADGTDVSSRRLGDILSRKVAASSRAQGIMGLITAGPTKAAIYAGAKLGKALRGMLRK